MSSSSSVKPIQKTKARFLIHTYLDISYTLTQNRNCDNFLRGIGVRKEVREGALNLKPTIRLSKSEGEYMLTTTYGEGKSHRITFQLGKPVTRELRNGAVATSLFLVKDNRLEETLCTNDLILTVTRLFGAEHVVVTMATSRGKCQRFYTKVRKLNDEDVGTETSRRSRLISGRNSSSGGLSSTESEIEIKNII